jgi:hypothetical protein
LAATTEGSWRSLFKAGAVLLPLAGVFLVAYEVLGTTLSNGFTPTTLPGQAWVTIVDYIGSNATSFNVDYVLLTLSVLAFLPAVLALYLALRRTDASFSLLGSSLAVSGIIIVLSNVSLQFFEVQEAQVWDGGCTICGNAPIEAAAGMPAAFTAEMLAFLLILISVLIFSVVILRGATFSKVSGYLGVLAFIVGIILSFVSLNGVAGEWQGVVPSVLLAVWAISLSPRLFKL